MPHLLMMDTEGLQGEKDGRVEVRTGLTAHCPNCRRQSQFIHARILVKRHLLLTLVTGGLWMPVWMLLLIGKCMRPWRCATCGWHKPEFRNPATGGPRLQRPITGSGARLEKVQPPTVE